MSKDLTRAQEDGTARLAGYLRASRHALVFTGAGISTASGIPDFRGPQGTWTKRRPIDYQSFLQSEAARIEHWEYKLDGWNVFRQAQPNAAHRAIRDLERAGRLLAVVTQNVDGLHAKAGTSADKLVELHGTNALVECLSCHRRDAVDPHLEYFKVHRKPPHCECGGILKTATISFGQKLSEQELERAYAAAIGCDLVLSLGSTLSVQPACSFPLMAAQRGVPYAIVNLGPTDHDDEPCVSLRLEADVSEVLPRAVAAAVHR
jgi:NAD-dependent protein deacetylase/lipoamidase